MHMISTLIIKPCIIIIEVTDVIEVKSRLNSNTYVQTNIGKKETP